METTGCILPQSARGASLNYDFKSQEAGLYLVKVEAQDGHGQAAQPAADGANSVEVRLNAQPVASFTKPAVGNSGTATVGNAVDFAVTVSDEESIDGFTYQWDYQAPGATDWMAFAPAAISKDFTLETKDLAPGSYNVRVNVTDEHGGRAEATYSLALQGNNPPHNLRFDPVVTTVQDDEWLQLASLAADTEQTFHVLAEDENVAGLKYEWVINGENKGIIGSQATLKLHSPLGKDQKQIGNDPHKVLVMIAVTDDMGNSNSIHRTLFVNVAPKVEQITPAEISRTEYEFELSQFSDTEADPITAYKWQKRGPGENEFVDMAGDDAKTGSVTLAEGQHQVRAKIQDEHGGWSDWSQPLSVDIGANHAPTLEFTAGTVAQDTWFNLANVTDDTARQTFSVVGSDEDKGDTLSYVWKVNGQEQQKGKDTAANLILYSPKKSGQTQMVPNDPHKVVVEVMAIDNYGAASKPLTRTLNVNVAPNPPAGITYTAGKLVEKNSGRWVREYELTLDEGNDPDGDDSQFKYEWQISQFDTPLDKDFTSFEQANNQNSSTVTVTLPVSTHTIRARLVDKHGGKGDWIEKEIKVRNQAPKITSIKTELGFFGPFAALENNTYTRAKPLQLERDQLKKFKVEVTDPNGDDIKTYTWTVNDQPAGEDDATVALDLSSTGAHEVKLAVEVSDGVADSISFERMLYVNVAPNPPAGITYTAGKLVDKDPGGIGRWERQYTFVLQLDSLADPDGDQITEFQWLKQIVGYNNANGFDEANDQNSRTVSVSLLPGKYKIWARLKDKEGSYSQWKITEEIVVSDGAAGN